MEELLSQFPKFKVEDQLYQGKLQTWKEKAQIYQTEEYEEYHLQIYLLLIKGDQLKNIQQNYLKVLQLLYETIYNKLYFSLIQKIPDLHLKIARALIYPIEEANAINNLSQLNQIFTAFSIFYYGIGNISQNDLIENREDELDYIHIYINTGIMKILGEGDLIWVDIQLYEIMEFEGRKIQDGLVDPNQILTLTCTFLKDYNDFEDKLTEEDSLFLKQLCKKKREQFMRSMDLILKLREQVMDQNKLQSLMIEKANMENAKNLDCIYNLKNKISNIEIAKQLFSSLKKGNRLWKGHFNYLSEQEKNKHLVGEMQNKKIIQLIICGRCLRSLGQWERGYIIFYYLFNLLKQSKQEQKYLTYITYQLAKLLYHLKCNIDSIYFLQQSLQLIQSQQESYHPKVNKLEFTLKIGFLLLSIQAFNPNQSQIQPILSFMTKTLTQTQQIKDTNKIEEIGYLLKNYKYQIKFLSFCEQLSSSFQFSFGELVKLRQNIQNIYSKRQSTYFISEDLYKVSQAPQIEALLQNTNMINKFIQKITKKRSTNNKPMNNTYPKCHIPHYTQFNVQMLILSILSDIFLYKQSPDPYSKVIENLELINPSFYPFIPTLFQYHPYSQFQDNLLSSYIQYYFSKYDDALLILINLQLVDSTHNYFRDKLLGQIYEIQGNYQSAIDIYLSINNNDPQILFNLANCYKILNQDQLAIQFYQQTADLSNFYRNASNYLIQKINNNYSYMVNSIIIKKSMSINSIQQDIIDESCEREDINFFCSVISKDIIPSHPKLEETLEQFREATKSYKYDSHYLNQNMEILVPISRGGQAEVWKIRFENGEYACKMYEYEIGNESIDNLKEALDEIIIMGNLNEINDGSLIKLEHIGFEFTKLDQTRIIKIKLILPFYQHGTLFNILLENRSNEFWLDFLWKLLFGIKILKDNQIAHLDLKPSNILIDNKFGPILADFGLSIEQFHSFVYSNFVKTSKKYTAPEILERSHFTKKSDIYSFGCIVYQIFSKKEPYYWLMEYQYHGGLQFGKEHKLGVIQDERIQEMILRCTESDVNKRFSIEETYEYFKIHFRNE